MQSTTIKLSIVPDFKQKALRWAAQFNQVVLFDSNAYQHDPYCKIEWKLTVDAMDFILPTQNHFEELKRFQQAKQTFICGIISYNCVQKNYKLTSQYTDAFGFPSLYFFEPRYVFEIKGEELIINRNYPETFELIEQINSFSVENQAGVDTIPFSECTHKDDYIRQVQDIRKRIEEGDFYEMNYCTEVVAENASIDPISVFEKLNATANAPYSCFVKYFDKYLLCASPERFICKRDDKLISQPIKGTIRRGENAEDDELQKRKLLGSEKERAENVMIVDLVRNDLTKYAVPGTIKVEELFGIYSFNTVHQMISTVSARLKSGENSIPAIENAFPMGSMTGAPKREVMKQINTFETFGRGLFSGSVGYFDEQGDFDLNVVIRSVLYDSVQRKIAIRTGSAITYDSIPEEEYAELVLKRDALIKSVNGLVRP